MGPLRLLQNLAVEKDPVSVNFITCRTTLKSTGMNPKRISAILLFALMIIGALAQGPELKVKVVGTDDVATIVRNISSSSSSSCNPSDFPVYQGETSRDVNFRDLKKVIVRQDIPAGDNVNYISVELVGRDGGSGIYEMIRNIRIQGISDQGKFSARIQDIKSIEVIN